MKTDFQALGFEWFSKDPKSEEKIGIPNIHA